MEEEKLVEYVTGDSSGFENETCWYIGIQKEIKSFGYDSKSLEDNQIKCHTKRIS